MRIAIVNGSRLAVEVLRRVILNAPGYKIAWIAKDGAEAVKKCADDLPDLVLMDLMMPIMNGVEATCKIMRETPCAILIVTATVTGHANKVFEAMSCGALDAVCTPVFAAGNKIEGGSQLLTKIASISRLFQKPTKYESGRSIAKLYKFSQIIPPLVVLGASAGGPKTLAKILGQLPSDFPGAVVVVQHVDAEFTASMVEWLDRQVPLPVRLVERGCSPKAAAVLLAGGNLHLVMNSACQLTYSTEPNDSPYRPSIDAFFISIAEHWPRKALAILLTGMGKDGALGLLKLRQAGWHTIAQDQATSVVYGMPRAAAELHAASEILPLCQISEAIVNFVRAKR